MINTASHCFMTVDGLKSLIFENCSFLLPGTATLVTPKNKSGQWAASIIHTLESKDELYLTATGKTVEEALHQLFSKVAEAVSKRICVHGYDNNPAIPWRLDKETGLDTPEAGDMATNNARSLTRPRSPSRSRSASRARSPSGSRSRSGSCSGSGSCSASRSRSGPRSRSSIVAPGLDTRAPQPVSNLAWIASTRPSRPGFSWLVSITWVPRGSITVILHVAADRYLLTRAAVVYVKSNLDMFSGIQPSDVAALDNGSLVLFSTRMSFKVGRRDKIDLGNHWGDFSDVVLSESEGRMDARPRVDITIKSSIQPRV